MQNAVKEKIKDNSGKLEHWMDYSKEKYGSKLVEDIKATLKVLYLFLPMPVFYTLIDQTGTTWTFQARRMDGYIGFYTILPDQMQLGNPVIFLALIPIYHYILGPALTKWKILTTPFQKIIFGGVLTALSFIVSACVALALETTYPTLPSKGNGQIRIYNTLPCNVTILCPSINSSPFTISHGNFYENVDLNVEVNASYSYTLTNSCSNISGALNLYEEQAVGYYFDGINTNLKYVIDDISKHERGLPKFRYMVRLLFRQNF